MKQNSKLASLFVLVAFVSLATTSGRLQAAGSPAAFTIATSFSPDPPKQGTEKLTVTVTDASGKPVKGASVSIASSMPSMSMAGPRVAAIDNHDGTYSATMPLKFATRWTFMITMSQNGKTGRATVSKDVR